MVDSKN